MTVARCVVSRAEFESRWRSAVGEFMAERGFETTYAWSFGGVSYVAYERPDARVWTWCDEREASIWTFVESLTVNHGLGLDTAESLLAAERRYPPDTAHPWDEGELERRLWLEAELLRELLEPILRRDDLLRDNGGELIARAQPIDDVEGRFYRDAGARLDFLEAAGFEKAIADMGSALTYRRGDVVAKIGLISVANEDEDEPGPEVYASVARSADTPSSFDSDWQELDVPPREAPFTLDYLDAALAQAATAIRTHPLISGGADV